MRKIFVIVGLLAGCERFQSDAEKELSSVTGVSVKCVHVDPKTSRSSAGYLCKDPSARHYYCPKSSGNPCYFTNKIQTTDEAFKVEKTDSGSVH